LQSHSDSQRCLLWFNILEVSPDSDSSDRHYDRCGFNRHWNSSFHEIQLARNLASLCTFERHLSGTGPEQYLCDRHSVNASPQVLLSLEMRGSGRFPDI